MASMDRLTRRSRNGANGSHPGRVPVGPQLDDEQLGVELRAYLECRCRNVDPPPRLVDAWDRFYDHYTPRIRAFLRRFGLPEADREDCVQDVWSRLLTRATALPANARRAQLWAWLMIVARNLAVDAIRRRHRRRVEWDEGAYDVVDEKPGPDALCDRRWTDDRVRIALAELSAEIPALSFQVLYLRTIADHTTAEVAEILGLTTRQVRFRLHRAKRKFRDHFERLVGPDHFEGDEGRPRGAEEESRATSQDLACLHK